MDGWVGGWWWVIDCMEGFSPGFLPILWEGFRNPKNSAKEWRGRKMV